MRHLRKAISVGFPILGMVLVFTAILVPTISLNLQLQIIVVLVGLLILEAGVWRLTEKILPNERKYTALREEVDAFIDRIRVLNAQGGKLRAEETVAELEAFQNTISALHESVDRMAELAGRED